VENNKVDNAISQADELLKFKKLLDDGVITQQEFDNKKEQLLSPKVEIPPSLFSFMDNPTALAIFIILVIVAMVYIWFFA